MTLSFPAPATAAASAPAPTEALRFAVRYSRPWWQGGQSDNTLGLRGAGTLLRLPGQIRLQGLRRRWTGASRPVEVVLHPQQVFNVLQEGRSVRFGLFAEGPVVETLRCWTADEAAAVALAAALPPTVVGGAAVALTEYREFQARLRTLGGAPRCTGALIAINAAVFAATVLGGGGLIEPDVRVLVDWGTNFGPLTLGGEWWRLLTATFLHFGLLHLLLNMWALRSGGALVERLFGARDFLLIYLLAGLTGSLASVVWNPLVNSAGASGAIFGVFGAMLAFFLRRDSQVPASVVRQQRSNGIFFIVVNLAYGFSQAGIDNAAHLGGLAAGLALGTLLARPLVASARQAS